MRDNEQIAVLFGKDERSVNRQIGRISKFVIADHMLFYFENESFLGIVFLWEEGIIIFVNWNYSERMIYQNDN